MAPREVTLSASEMGSSVLGVVGRPNSTRSAAKATRPGAWRQSVSGKAQRLHERVHSGQYWPKPVRRTYIPKSDGGRRPLGIPALEDKIAQGAVAEVLNAVYEADFIGFIHGFRPGVARIRPWRPWKKR